MTIKKNSHSHLRIRDLELRVHLGWPEEEREKSQIVLVTVDIWFVDFPKACLSDQLQDTICYDTLIDTLRNNVSNKPFRLIEHLTFALYQLIKNEMPKHTLINVALSKYPEISGLKGGVTFYYSDK